MIEYLKDEYEIINPLGTGGMAHVYLAKEKITGKLVAIKVLKSTQKNSEIIRRRFMQEIKLMQKLNSQYIVKIYDFKFDEEKQYIVMEYIEGTILKDLVKMKGRLSAKEVVDFSTQIAAGLAIIHGAGITHRDVKNTNIMITNNGEVKIIDLGIAWTKETDQLTKTGSIIGSPQYIAPEIVRQQTKGTAQTDIYALGIVMFHMLTGYLPFNESDSTKTAYAHLEKKVPNITKLFPTIPQSLSNVVLKATAKDINVRYSSAVEMIKDLKTVLSSNRKVESRIKLTPKNNMSFKDFINSKWFWAIISGTFIAILITIIIVLVVAG